MLHPALMRFGTAGPVVEHPGPTDPVAEALARLSEAQAMCVAPVRSYVHRRHVAHRLRVLTCAKDLEALSNSHDTSSVWASTGIAVVVRLCQDPAAAAAAATALSHLSDLTEHGVDANTVAITEAGAITVLVALLSGGTESVAATKAALALSNLAINDANRAAIVGAGAISPLVRLLSGGRPGSEAAANAASALASLMADTNRAVSMECNASYRVAIAEAGAIPPLVVLLSGGLESACSAYCGYSAACSAEAAEHAAYALSMLARHDSYRITIAEAGAIPPLMALLSGGIGHMATVYAAYALCNLSYKEANKAAITEAGAIQLLVALLCEATGLYPTVVVRLAIGLHNLAQDTEGRAAVIRASAIPPLVALLGGGPESKSAEKAAMVLNDLAHDTEGRAIMIGAGAIPRLVTFLGQALLSGGGESKAAGSAAWTLSWLACNTEGRVAIVAAEGIPQLVALLSGGPESGTAFGTAAAAALALSNLAKPWLSNLACGTHHTAVLEELARTQTSCSPWDRLREAMCRSASGQLVVAGVEQAITLATAVHAAALECAQESLELNGDAERHQARLESFGLDSLELPEEFVCPITWAKMQGVPPPPSLPRRAPPPRLPRLRFCRPGGGVRRPHLRALRHPFGLPRRQRLEPAHPRAAAAKRAHPEP